VTVGGRDDASTGWTAGQPTADGQTDGRPEPKNAAAATNGMSVGATPAGRGGPPTGSTVAVGATGTERLIDVRV
jgi:hypothetical protein